MLELVELTGFGDHHPWQLSGGMQQRVVDRARARVRAGAAADGRAVRRARRDDARAAQPRAALDLAAAALDGRLRHALDLGGGVPLDARRRDEPAAGPDQRHRRRSTCPTRARSRRARTRGSSSSSRRCASCCAAAASSCCPRRRRRSSRGVDGAPVDGAGAPVAVSRVRHYAREWLPAVLVLVAALVLWEGAIAAFNVQQFLLPRPSAIARDLRDNWSTLSSAGWYTFKEALGGFVVGSLVGILFARVRRTLPCRRRGADAVRDRRERGPDHRVRADLQRLVQPALAALEDGDRGRPLLLPGDGEHAPRADERARLAGAADAQLRGRATSRSSAASGSRPRSHTCSPRSRWRACSR